MLLASGHDSRGLVYALLELADRMNYGASPLEALKVPEPIIEKPAVRIRSIYRAFASEVEDKSWYNDREFWTNYLTELATHGALMATRSIRMTGLPQPWRLPSLPKWDGRTGWSISTITTGLIKAWNGKRPRIKKV